MGCAEMRRFPLGSSEILSDPSNFSLAVNLISSLAMGSFLSPCVLNIGQIPVSFVLFILLGVDFTITALMFFARIFIFCSPTLCVFPRTRIEVIYTERVELTRSI